MTDREWMQSASCTQTDPDAFFPESRDYRAQAEAKRICISCPVLQTCNAYRRTTNPSHGVWAGEFLNDPHYHTNRDALYDHGTNAAYLRHRRAGEKPCEPCLRAERVRSFDRAERKRRQG